MNNSRHTAVLWPHRLVFNFPYGRWVSALLLFSISYLTFYLLGAEGEGADKAVPVFFCLVFAYIAPASHYINQKSVEAFDSLKTILVLDESKIHEVRNAILEVPLSNQFKVTTLGLTAGCIHAYVLLIVNGEFFEVLGILTIRDTTIMLSTILIWILLTTTITFLTRNVSIFARLAKENVKVDLLNTPSLYGFARVAVYSTLLLMGVLASFPILLIEDETSTLTVVPGLLATSLPMIYLFLVPLLPIRVRIKEKKSLELANIQERIKVITHNSENLSNDLEKLATLQPLLEYRREIDQVSEWPFDSPVMFRLFFYLIIPPMTWVGAALIERLIDTVSF
jgi:hypothetical protein